MINTVRCAATVKPSTYQVCNYHTVASWVGVSTSSGNKREHYSFKMQHCRHVPTGHGQLRGKTSLSFLALTPALCNSPFS